MSLKAKGLLSLMLSLPDNWDYSISGLVSISKDARFLRILVVRVVDINLLTCKNHILKIGNVNVCFLWLILYELKKTKDLECLIL